MFTSIFVNGSLTAGSVFLSLGLALLLGFAGALYYTKRNITATRSFAFTLALLPIIITTVIMVVNGNLGAGIAVAGSFSLIRFRSIKSNARELISVFFSMAIGLALGMGQVLFAVVFTVLTCIILLITGRLHFGEGKNNKRLKIVVPEDLDYEKMFDKVIDKYTNEANLIKCKTINMGSLYELVYEVEMKPDASGRDFIDELRTKNGNLKVILSN